MQGYSCVNTPTNPPMFKLKTPRLLSFLMIIAGALCIIFPLAGTLAVDVLVGLALLFAAFFSLFQIPYASGAWAKLLNVVLFIIYLLAGGFLLKYIPAGALAIATIVGAFMIVEGVFSFIAWANVRGQKNAFLLLLNGIATLIIGAVFLLNTQEDFFLLGLLFGLNLFFTGFASLTWTEAE